MQSYVASERAATVDVSAAPSSRNKVLLSPREETWRRWLVDLTLIFSDLVVAVFVWELACLVQIFRVPGSLTGLTVASIIPVALVWVGLRATRGLYPGYGLDEPEELRGQTYALLATLAFAAIFALAFHIGDAVSRFLLVLVFTGLLIFSPLMRHFVKGWMMRQGVWGKPVIILGEKDAGARLEEALAQEWRLGFNPVTCFVSWSEGVPAEVKEGDEGEPHEDILVEAVRLGRRHRIDTLFLVMPHVPQEYLAGVTDLAGLHFRSVVVIAEVAGVSNSTVVARNLAGNFGVEVRHNLLDPWICRFKRALDLAGAVVGGMLISPLLLTVALMIKLDSPGPVFFGHRRLGADGKHFRCWKFRTMHADADKVLEAYLEQNPQLMAEWKRSYKLRDDPRVTRVGRLLRKSSLDELPQLWNVLRAEMSLVGPRPIVDAEVSKYGKVYGLYKRTRPGMSGFWQVGGRSDTDYDERISMDAHYVRNWSVWLDLVILARTVRCVLSGRGAV